MIRKLKVAVKGIETELETLRRFGAKNLPNTFRAFLGIGDAIYKAIQRVAADKGVARRSGAYLKRWHDSISYPYEGDPFRLHMENDLPYAVALEEGRPEIDMLSHFLRSPKTRMSAKNKPYLIIPFRHGTPGSVTMSPMPESVHNIVKQREFKQSRVLEGQFSQSPNVFGDLRKRWTYKWGSRYSAGQGQALHKAEGKQWASGKYEGMVKMSDPESKHVTYYTFRVASAASRERNPNAWKIPPMAGKYIAETALSQMEHFIEQTLHEAVVKDFYGMARTG